MSGNLNYNNCMVSECRFPTYHVTAGHNCGSCKKYGHGIIECTNPIKKAALASYMSDILPASKQCKFGECKYKHLHTSEAHHCTLCQNRMHSLNTCPKNPIENKFDIQCQLCKKTNQISKNQQKIFGLTDTCIVCMDNNVEVFFPTCGHVCVCMSCFKILTKQNNVDIFDDIRDQEFLEKQKYPIDKINLVLKDYPSYIIIYEGMGCCTIVRRLNLNSPIEGLFNHSDDGYNSDKMKKIKEFVNGYCWIENNDIYHEWKGYESFEN